MAISAIAVGMGVCPLPITGIAMTSIGNSLFLGGFYAARYKSLELGMQASIVLLARSVLKRKATLLLIDLIVLKYDLEDYFAGFALQGFQNNPIFRASTKK